MVPKLLWLSIDVQSVSGITTGISIYPDHKAEKIEHNLNHCGNFKFDIGNLF